MVGQNNWCKRHTVGEGRFDKRNTSELEGNKSSCAKKQDSKKIVDGDKKDRYGSVRGVVTPRSSGPGPCLPERRGFACRPLPRCVRLRLAAPLSPTAENRYPLGWNATVLSLVHNERDVVDNAQPFGIVLRKVVKVGRGADRCSPNPTGILLL